MFDQNTLDDNSEVETVTFLQRQDDLYENEGDSEVDDATYDRIRRWASLAFSANKYFTGAGSSTRGGKVNLPFSMSGLTQVYEGGDTHKWAYKIGGNAVEYVISDKMDGTSAMVIYDPGGYLQIAYSRGDTQQGADITRNIKKIPNIPHKIPALGYTLPVRMEIEIKKSDWNHVQSTFTKSNGEPYKNARNTVAGVMNASGKDDGIHNYLNGVAYTVMESELSKINQFNLLIRCGFEVARHEQVTCLELDDTTLTKMLNATRETCDYELDGIVVDINEYRGRKHAGTIGQPTTVKFKVADASNFAICVVKDVIYRASKDGYLKPRVNIQPTNLCGVTVSFATGFNAGHIRKHGIGPGAKIRITRSGDVIPYILSTIDRVNPALPCNKEHGDWSWSVNDNDEEIDAVLNDVSSNKGVTIRKNTDIFTKLKIAHLKGGSIEKLYDAGYETAQSIMNAEYTDLYMVLGENGGKIDDSLDEQLTGIYWPEFVGSLNICRGIGRRKMTALYDGLQGDVSKMSDIDAICALDSFDEKTAKKIVENIDDALQFIEDVEDRVTLSFYTTPVAPKGSRMKGKGVVFTGVRSAEVEKKISEEGGEVKSGISSKVQYLVCKDVNSNSGKANKARKLGITIVDLKGMERILYS